MLNKYILSPPEKEIYPSRDFARLVLLHAHLTPQCLQGLLLCISDSKVKEWAMSLETITQKSGQMVMSLASPVLSWKQFSWCPSPAFASTEVQDNVSDSCLLQTFYPFAAVWPLSFLMYNPTETLLQLQVQPSASGCQFDTVQTAVTKSNSLCLNFQWLFVNGQVQSNSWIALMICPSCHIKAVKHFLTLATRGLS